MAQNCDKVVVLSGTPIFALLGKRGVTEIIDVLIDGDTWSMRGLADAVGVHHQIVARAVTGLQELGMVEVLRPRRDSIITWRPDNVYAKFVASLEPPRVPELQFDAAFTAFAPYPIAWWDQSQQTLAIICQSDDELDTASDKIDELLDQWSAMGVPHVECAPVLRNELLGDEEGRRILRDAGLDCDATQHDP